MDFKAQMAQVLELLTRQQVPAAPAAAPAPPLPAPISAPVSPKGAQCERAAPSPMEEKEALSIAASWGEGSSPGGRRGAYRSLTSRSLVLRLPFAGPLAVFWTQAVAPCLQPFPAFPDFMEQVRSSWDRPALAPSVLKQVSQLASLEGAEKLGLAGFPPVDSTIAALVKAPEPAVQGYGNTPVEGICSGGTGTLLQITGLQGQALGQSLASLVVARRQLWQARVPDADKAALLDASISPGHTFGPAVEEILQSSHQERVSASGRATPSLCSHTGQVELLAISPGTHHYQDCSGSYGSP
ncbi:UNVERIFIED_CONTAM: hypothetical protein FKN15_012297 [Acipenser sinensis]